jgi:hypothetical protein
VCATKNAQHHPRFNNSNFRAPHGASWNSSQKKTLTMPTRCMLQNPRSDKGASIHESKRNTQHNIHMRFKMQYTCTPKGILPSACAHLASESLGSPACIACSHLPDVLPYFQLCTTRGIFWFTLLPLPQRFQAQPVHLQLECVRVISVNGQRAWEAQRCSSTHLQTAAAAAAAALRHNTSWLNTALWS